MSGINVLSLFNGVGGAFMALDELGVEINKLYVSEIDKFANKAADVITSDNIHLGDITKWDGWQDNHGVNFSEIDIIFAGFPCQAWSMAGKQKGDGDPRGALVHDLLEIWNHVKSLNPRVKFLFENVKMKAEFMQYINGLFDCDGYEINAALVTAQNRKRYYWCNWELSQPEDKGILLKDIIEHGDADRDKSLTVTTRVSGATQKRYLEKSMHQMVIMSDKFTERNKGRSCLVDKPKDKASNLSAMEYVKNGRQGDYIKCDKDGTQLVFAGAMRGRYLVAGKRADHTVDNLKGKTEQRLEVRPDEKSNCLTTVQKDNVVVMKSTGRGYNKGFEKEVEKTGTLTSNAWEQNNKISTDSGFKYRKLTPRECMRLQGFPEHHIERLLSSGISNTQLYKMTGNGWAHPVIVHILKELLTTGWSND